MIFIPKRSLKMRGFHSHDLNTILYYAPNIRIADTKPIKKFQLKAFYPYKYEKVEPSIIKLNKGQFLYLSTWFTYNVLHFKGSFNDLNR